MSDRETDARPSLPRPEDCLTGGGEMGALMRSIDWGQTVFGPVASWPQSLRTAVSIMLESRFAMVVAWGPEFRFFYNDRYRPILGLTKHPAALGRAGAEIFPEVWSVVGPEFERVRRGEAFAVDDWLLPLDRNGYLENCYFTLSYSPIRDESGGVGGLLAVVAETTGRVEGERRLATLRDLARRASEAKTPEAACADAAAVLAQNPIDVPFALLYLLGPDGTHARRVAAAGLPGDHPANPEVVDLAADEAGSGWPLARVVGAGRTEVLSDLRRRFGPLPGGPYPENTHTAVLLPLVRPGQTRPYGVVVAGVSPRRELDDRYRGFLELAGDHIATAVGNARAFEEERRRAEALAEIDRAKTTFFSNVSHEFRTPLTLLLGPTEDALASPQRALSGDALDTVHRNALRLLKLVNALLDFSRLEAGRIQASYEPLDLATLTEEVASGFRSAVERAGLTLTVRADPLTEPAYVDREMWEKIVLNLLSNAFKFTFAGGIRVDLRQTADRFELAVADSGVGIQAEELPHLFERFHRVEGARSRSHEGSGIGLALVQELARMHGGDVSVASAPGRGSTFTVSIPRGSAHLPAERTGVERQRRPSQGPAPFVEEALRWVDDPGQRSPSGPAGAARILVADDNADMRAYLQRILGARWTVETASDGAAALEAARGRPPDLVLTDVMMPGLSGFELLRALRADEATRQVPVVMLSARAGEDARIEGLETGADDYLVKPFSARELVARVSSQLTLARARREAELQKQHLYALFTQAPTPIVILRGPRHVIELANPLTCQLWGRRQEEVVGRPLLEALPELEDQAFQRLLDGVLGTGEPCVGRETPAQLHRRSDGRLETVYLNFVYSPLRGVDGDIEGVLVIAFDVTHEVLARRQLDGLRTEAEAANRTKDEFLAMLSHELRNPLAPIATALQLMCMREGAEAVERERSIIERQVKNLTRLVDDLLDVSRVTRGKIELDRRPLELAEVVAKGIEVAGPLLEARQHQLVVNVPAAGLPVHADEHRLAQVVANLLTNAAKYTDPKGQVTIEARRDGGDALLDVRDNGIGIAEDLLPHVFDLFYQGPRALDRSHGGLGLGLAIVRSLVALHGGSVTAASAGPGRGSSFTVRLPLGEAPVEATTSLVRSRSLEPAAPEAPRILVVDDNHDAANVLAEALNAVGYTTRTAYDGPAAIEVLRSFRPAVALLDLGLPVMDGYELARRLRETPEGAELRLVAVTGYGQALHRERSRLAGFDEHLVKPLDVTAVPQLIQRLAAERGSGRDRPES